MNELTCTLDRTALELLKRTRVEQDGTRVLVRSEIPTAPAELLRQMLDGEAQTKH